MHMIVLDLLFMLHLKKNQENILLCRKCSSCVKRKSYGQLTQNKLESWNGQY